MGTALCPRLLEARLQKAEDPMVRLAERILAASGDSVLRLVEAELRRGLSWQTLQGALFLAGMREINPIPVGGKLHAVLVVPAVFDLAEAGSTSEALLPVLYNLREIKESQARDVEEGDWRLPARPAIDSDDVDSGRGALEAALRARDGAAADRALTGLLGTEDPRQLYECFWPAGARSFAGLAHKMILVAQVHRSLDRIGWQRSEPALRALAYALSDRYRVDEYPDDDEVRGAAGAMRAGSAGVPDPDVSLALFGRLVAASPESAVEIVLARRRDGVSEATIWDALFLAASDVFARGPGLLPVHPVTVMNAMAYAFRSTSVPSTRGFLLLRAASWIPTFRDDLAGRRSLSMDGPGLQELQPARAERDVSVEEVFREPTRQGVVALVARKDRRQRFEAQLRRHLVRGASEVHQIKFCAAVLENARRAHPSLAPWILAPVLDYLPGAAADETELHAESVELIRRLG